MQQGGLLVEPKDIAEGAGPKLLPERVAETVSADPGISIFQLAARLGVSKPTAWRYIKSAEADGRLYRIAERLYTADPTVSPFHKG